MENKQIIITTSWDDGYDLDVRIAELLEKYKLNGTFYVPIRNREHPVMNALILSEIANKYEIGGHTVNHIYLNTLGMVDANYEISACKTMLQDELGKKVEAFCFPGGKYSQRDIELVKEAGFLFGRTARLLHTSSNIDQNLLDTSIQVYNHSSFILTAHCMKNIFLLPIVQNCFFYKGNKYFPKLAEILINRILATGGVFHLWGHSWEIEKYGLWREFEMVLKMLAFNKDVVYLNNTECWKILTTNKPIRS